MYRGNSKSLDGKNNVVTNKMLINKSDGTGGCSSKYIKLYSDIGDTFAELLELYSTGNYSDVAQQLTFKEFESLAFKIYSHKTLSKQCKYFEKYRVLFTYILSGIQQSVYQYINLTETLAELEQCKELAAILDDNEKLKEYLESKKKNFSIFPNQSITIIKALLPPEYEIYIELYGLPNNGLFEPDKLAAIALELNTVNVNNEIIEECD